MDAGGRWVWQVGGSAKIDPEISGQHGSLDAAAATGGNGNFAFKIGLGIASGAGLEVLGLDRAFLEA